MSQFIGMDFLYSVKAYVQSIQTDKTGTRVLVNSTFGGEVLTVKPVPKTIVEKPWFTRKIRYPRNYLGISKIDERVSKLSYLVHILTNYGIPTRRIAKKVSRLSLIWHSVPYEHMRKHVGTITREVSRLNGLTRSPWVLSKRSLPSFPVYTGVKNHENGISVPLFKRANPYLKEGNISVKTETSS